MDVAAFMSALGAQWFFGVGCRTGSHTNVKAELPNFPYEFLGVQGVGFAAVNIFWSTKSCPPVQWQAAWSTSSRSCWASVAEVQHWVGFYVPPKGPGATEADRREIVLRIFQEVDMVKEQLSRRGGAAERHQICGVGDLNPSEDILRLYR